MKNNKIVRNRKAVSPVIATVILVAVTISVAIGVTYWMAGISAQYTQFEKIEIQTGYSTLDTANGWLITLTLKNSGSAPSTITNVFLNALPVTPAADSFGMDGTIVTNLPAAGLPIMAGEDKPIQIWIASGGGVGTPAEFLSSGTTVNIKLHSASGMDYIKLIKLT